MLFERSLKNRFFILSLALLSLHWLLLASTLEGSTANKSVRPLGAEEIQKIVQSQSHSLNKVSLSSTGEGLLFCEFQDLKAVVNAHGMELHSLSDAVKTESSFFLCPSSWSRGTSEVRVEAGTVRLEGDKVLLDHPAGFQQEFSTSMDGVRQDFILQNKLAGHGNLRLTLALNGARVLGHKNDGVKLEMQGRELAYQGLKVIDATGAHVVAKMSRIDDHHIAIEVEDQQASYPLRIDPTVSSGSWTGLGSNGFEAVFNDGSIKAIAINGTDVYVGGDFSDAGWLGEADFIAKWNGTAWSALGNNGAGIGALNSYVNAISISGNNVYVGGAFTNAGGVAEADYIAKWDGFAWSALGNNGAGIGALNLHVVAIAISGTDVFVGGGFTNAGGNSEADRISKWDGATWSALGNNGAGDGALNNSVSSIAISGTDVYVGGNFVDVGGIAEADKIAKWDGFAWSALGNNGAGVGALNNEVNAIAISGMDVYVGGIFSNASGVAEADCIAKWNGSSWSALGNNGAGGALNGGVTSLAVSGTDVYVAGVFTNAGGVGEADRIAKWDGTAWSALGNNGNSEGALDNHAYTIAISGSNIYVGGPFLNACNLADADRLAKWDGSAWSSIGNNGPDGALKDFVNTMAISGTDIYVGGAFTNAGGNTEADYIAKWDGTAWSALGNNGAGDGALDYHVYTIAINGTDVYVGGEFYNAGGNTEADKIAKWDGSTWSALGNNGAGNGAIDFSVHAFAFSGTDVYVGGEFTNAGGNPEADRIAKWDGTTWSALGNNGAGDGALNNIVYAIAISGTDIYVGGGFENTSGNTETDWIAKWDGTVWSALGNNGAGDGALNNAVRAIAISGTDVYVGGAFTTAGGNTVADFIAKWDGTAWSALGSNGGIVGALNSGVRAIAISGTDVYVGGYFTNAGGNSDADRIAKWDGITWSALGKNNGTGLGYVNAWVSTIAISGGNLYVGGQFINASRNSSSDYIALFDPSAPPVITQGANLNYNILNNTTLYLSSANISATHPEFNALTWSISSNALQGNVTIFTQSNNAINSLVYMPNTNYNGSDNFTLQVSDEYGGTDVISIDVSIISTPILCGNSLLGSGNNMPLYPNDMNVPVLSFGLLEGTNYSMINAIHIPVSGNLYNLSMATLQSNTGMSWNGSFNYVANRIEFPALSHSINGNVIFTLTAGITSNPNAGVMSFSVGAGNVFTSGLQQPVGPNFIVNWDVEAPLPPVLSGNSLLGSGNTIPLYPNDMNVPVLSFGLQKGTNPSMINSIHIPVNGNLYNLSMATLQSNTGMNWNGSFNYGTNMIEFPALSYNINDNIFFTLTAGITSTPNPGVMSFMIGVENVFTSGLLQPVGPNIIVNWNVNTITPTSGLDLFSESGATTQIDKGAMGNVLKFKLAPKSGPEQLQTLMINFTGTSMATTDFTSIQLLREDGYNYGNGFLNSMSAYFPYLMGNVISGNTIFIVRLGVNPATMLNNFGLSVNGQYITLAGGNLVTGFAENASIVLVNPAPNFERLRIASGARSAYGLGINNIIHSAGRNEVGQLGRSGNPAIEGSISSAPAIAISAGDRHAIALAQNGNLITWGANEYGQSNPSGLVETDTSLDPAVQVEAGAYSSFVITSTNKLYAKGKNDKGQLGLGDFIDRNNWVQVTGLPVGGNIQDVSSGIEHTLVLIDGVIYGFGSNGFGQLGQVNTNLLLNTPTVLDGNNPTWTNVEAGGFHSMALNSSGQVFSWGKNDKGQLGQGSRTQIYVPTLISSLSNVVSISAGYGHSLFLLDDGINRRCFGTGDNHQGQAGQMVNFVLAPMQISAYTDVEEISAGPYTSLLIRANQWVKIWGQLPDGRNEAHLEVFLDLQIMPQ